MQAIHIVDLVSDNKDKRYEPAGRMAMAIIEIIQDQGECLPQHLNARGFSPDEISRHWHLAKSLAAVELRLMAAAPARPKSVVGKR